MYVYLPPFHVLFSFIRWPFHISLNQILNKYLWVSELYSLEYSVVVDLLINWFFPFLFIISSAVEQQTLSTLHLFMNKTVPTTDLHIQFTFSRPLFFYMFPFNLFTLGLCTNRLSFTIFFF